MEFHLTTKISKKKQDLDASLLIETNSKNANNRLTSQSERPYQRQRFQQTPKPIPTWYEAMENANLFLSREKNSRQNSNY